MTHAFAHRGVMLDLARLIEQHDYYRQLLPQLADWGYNLLHLHVTDDQGCPLVFPSHPELATPHAYSADEMRAFCDAARQAGLEVVPEIECFGHTDFITRHRKYRHLREAGEGPAQFSGLCVFEPEARRILEDLLRDTADIFRPRLIHAGLDEVNFGNHPTSRRLLRKRPKNQLFADHVLWCHDVVASLGSRMAVWGDHFLHDADQAVIASRTPRDTVIFDWHYNHDCDPRSMDFFISRGFEVYGAPAIQHSGCRVITGPENFENVRRFSAYALQRRRPTPSGGAVTGMVVTVWCPYRYVPGTIEYPLALAGRLFDSEDLEPAGFAAQFAAEFWGLRGAAARKAGHAVESLYAAAPNRKEYERMLFGANPWGPSESFSRLDRHVARGRLPAVLDAGRALAAAVPLARRNAGRLRDLLAAAGFLAALYTFAVRGRQGDPGWRRVLKSVQAAWARSRYTEGPAYTRSVRPSDKSRGGLDAVLLHLNRLAAGTRKPR